MKKILFLLLLTCAGYAQIPTTGQEFELDYGVRNNVSPTDDNAPYFTVQNSDNVLGKSTSSVWAKRIYVDNAAAKKDYLSTGLIKNGLVQANADPTKFNITAGIGVISNFDDPENPIITLVSFPAFTGITPTYLTTGNITYIAINSSSAVVMQATQFTDIQRRDLIILGAVIHSNLSTINLVNNISAPVNGATNQLHDLYEFIGALNLSGNKYVANGANLSLNKSAGDIGKLGVNFANNWKDPNKLTISGQTALTFRYRTQNGTEGSDITSLNPAVYDVSNVLTAVPSNRFSIQTVTLFQTGATRIQYGQNTYATMADAEAAILTRNYAVESNIAMNGITRAYVILRNNATDLTNATTSKIIEATKFGGTASGGVALTDVSIIAALGYTPENVANKSNSYTASSSTTYASTKALVDGLSSINKIENAADYGFLPTATATANVSALNSALLGGNKTLIITKPGVYLMDNTVYIDDNTNLIFGKGVVLKKVSYYTIAVINRGALTRTENKNIKIQGCKIITDGFLNQFIPSDSLYGLDGIISFFHINNLEIIDTEILDIPVSDFAIQVCTFNNIHINGFNLKGLKDGIHLGRGKNFLIENGTCETYDDAIALNGHDYPGLTPEVGNIEDGVIRNITDLYKTPTSGYFSRLLLGAWVDWYSGIQLQKGDAIVHGGKTYRIEGVAGTSYNSAIFPTIPFGQNSVVAPEGFTLIRGSDDAVYSANIKNVKYENIKCYSDRVVIDTEIDLGSSYNRSIHPDVSLSDYPYIDINVNNLISTSTNYMLGIPNDITSTVVLEKCKPYGKLIWVGNANFLKSKIIIDKCDFRNITGDGISVSGSDLILKNSIYSTTSIPISIGTGTRIRTSDNLSSMTNIAPIKGDEIVFNNIPKVYDGSVWIDQNIKGITVTASNTNVPKLNSSGDLINSAIYDDGTSVTVYSDLNADYSSFIGQSFRNSSGGIGFNRRVTDGYIYNSGSSAFQIQQAANTLQFQTYGTGNFDFGGAITATSIIKSGGTSSQFLKADGSIDNSVYSPLASPSFTGTPTAPTATAGTNTTQIATTAFVTNGLSAKASLSGDQVFTGTVQSNGFITGYSYTLGSFDTGLVLGSINFLAKNPNYWQSNSAIWATSFVATSGTIRLKSYTVSTLPTGTQGDTAYVTDALTPTYLGVLVGGGAVVTPVFYNGTNWVAH